MAKRNEPRKRGQPQRVNSGSNASKDRAPIPPDREGQESTKTGKRSSAQKEASSRQSPAAKPPPYATHKQGAFGKERISAAEDIAESQERSLQRSRERPDRKPP